MEEEHRDGIYPPKVSITPANEREKPEPRINVMFPNVKEKYGLNTQVTLLSGTCSYTNYGLCICLSVHLQ